jgi:hypothetical protein
MESYCLNAKRKFLGLLAQFFVDLHILSQGSDTQIRYHRFVSNAIAQLFVVCIYPQFLWHLINLVYFRDPDLSV